MADLIDRQKIKARLEPWLKVKDYSEGELNMLKAVLYEITVMPSVDTDLSGFSDRLWKSAYECGKAEAVRWISCSERLPDKKTEVIYSLENHYVSTGYMTDRDYNGDEMELHWEDMESGALIYPEAWMPLPKPYEGSE